MKTTDSIKLFRAVIGAMFLMIVVAGLIQMVGATSTMTTYSWGHIINAILMILACHWSIEWIKDLFHDQH